jgi:cell division protein FtsI (penicillin-binding protein 3)
MRSGAATLPRGKVPSLTLPRFRAPIVFGALLLVFAVLAGRSIYLQWFDNEFLQEQGSARAAARLRCLRIAGAFSTGWAEQLAISTPVKSLWVFPAKFDATPAQLGSLAKVLEVNPQVLARKVDSGDDFAYIAKQLP